MNPIDRASFDAFCVALQSFPCRLAERPGPQSIAFANMSTIAMNGQHSGKAFVNTQRRNFWSVVHIGVTCPVLRGVHMGKSEAVDVGTTAGQDADDSADSDASKASDPMGQVVVHRFQLRYADIPIEPVIEVVEPLVSLAAASPSGKTLIDMDPSDVRGFNKRVADAVRAVLGSGVRVGRAGRRRESISWRPSLW